MGVGWAGHERTLTASVTHMRNFFSWRQTTAGLHDTS